MDLMSCVSQYRLEPAADVDHLSQVQSYNRVQPVQPAQSEGEEIKIHKRVNWLPLGKSVKKGAGEGYVTFKNLVSAKDEEFGWKFKGKFYFYKVKV